MSIWIRLTILSVLTLSGAAGAAWAEEPAPKAGTKSASIEMNAEEIKGDLGNIVDSFKMNQMEILGDIQSPKILFKDPWDLPDPFFSETEGSTARQLIEQAYQPVDRESLDMQAGLIGGPGPADLASGRSSGFLGLADSR